MDVEHELCGNCKKEIPQHNYVMHTAHCSRNITFCNVCREPISKNQFEEHKKGCVEKPKKKVHTPPPPTTLEKSKYFQTQKSIEDKKAQVRNELKQKRYERFVDVGHTMKSSTEQRENNAEVLGAKSKPLSTVAPAPAPPRPAPSKAKSDGLLPCKFCDLELPKLELEDHENYCGSRTDKCLECGELVMFKYKQIHMDSNHGFLKLKDEPGPRASWDSQSARSTTAERPRQQRPEPFRPFTTFDATMYAFPTTLSSAGQPKEKGESYKEISRRLDCKTEYIRNLLHDSASITVPLRHNGAVPRNHFNHSKGPAPQPPRTKYRNPPTELVIPCEFCATPVPHEDLIQHETGCRPDLARFKPRRRSPEPDDYFIAPQPSSPEVELPCEFCADMIPASQLLRHQSTCA